MAHLNRWFTYEKWWIFPVRYVSLPEGTPTPKVVFFSHFEKTPEVFDTAMFRFEHCLVEHLADCCN